MGNRGKRATAWREACEVIAGRSLNDVVAKEVARFNFSLEFVLGWRGTVRSISGARYCKCVLSQVAET